MERACSELGCSGTDLAAALLRLALGETKEDGIDSYCLPCPLDELGRRNRGRRDGRGGGRRFDGRERRERRFDGREGGERRFDGRDGRESRFDGRGRSRSRFDRAERDRKGFGRQERMRSKAG